MTANKDFKRLARSRMHKTGESYTAARLQMLNRTAQRPKPAAPSPAEYAALAGLSDAAIKAKTGCTWERWVKALDYRKAYEWPHRVRWLPDVKPVIRTATAAKSMRLTWPDGTSVLVGFAAKGAAKSQVAIQHVRLPDRETATRMKQYWAARLGALTEVLAPASA